MCVGNCQKCKSCEHLKIRFIGVTKDKKTGLMSATYTSNNSCPLRCPFRVSKTCYAMFGPCYLHFVKEMDKFGIPVEMLLEKIKNTAHLNIVRHNIAGDIAKSGTNDIDEDLVELLTETYKKAGVSAYTYTHCEQNERNYEIVKEASENGFIINFSTETVENAIDAVKHGVNAVLAVNKMNGKVKVVDGVVFVKCPADAKNGKYCANCGICYQKNRKQVVVFEAHGGGKKKIDFLNDL